MLHIFVDASQMQGDKLTVTGTEVNHIKNVMRMKPGDEISVSCTEVGRDYRYAIESFEEDAVICHLQEVIADSHELPSKIYLFQGLPKADKMELIIQKAVELGVTEVIPVETTRCVVRLDDKKAAKKIERWQKIAESAAMQSKRSIIPTVAMPMKLEEALRYAGDHAQLKVIPYELQQDDGSTKELLQGLQPGQNVAVFIGPEGGFEEKEVELAREGGVVPITLGRRILRTETAGLMFLSWLTYILEIH